VPAHAPQPLGRQARNARLGRARHAGPPLVLIAVIVALGAYRGAAMLAGPARDRPWPLSAVSRSASVDVGVTTGPLGLNEWREWQPRDLRTVNAFENVVHKHVSVVMWYADWHQDPASHAQLQAIARRGSLPEITWEPWDYTKAAYNRQPSYTLASIIGGSHDAYIRSWARALAAAGGPVRLRFAQEMNGNWYPWAEVTNGNRRGQFVHAWRHVHDLFRAAGATNVQWVWSPVALADSINTELYPGDRYVDIIGLSLFNGGAQLKFNRWQSFAEKIGRPLAAVRRISRRKPIEVSEVGVAEQGGSKARWISGMFQTLNANPRIISLVWFDLHTASDWRVESSRSAEAAFAAAVSSPRYR